MTPLTLGSLFDGSGGFPLAGLMNGIRPVWASEVEPFPIRVTTKRLPMMRHLGDISTINGASVESVDIVTFGSPCTNLSVAGRREGLAGQQSSLFFQAIRIIHEMRRHTHGAYPKYIVFENVPGVFSSNDGLDFRVILEDISCLAQPNLSIPMPKDGKWLRAGEIVGEGFSIAWRCLDAQHWGIPQRRNRVYLVADLGGTRAGAILFDHESLSGYTPQSFSAWAASSACAANGVALASGFQEPCGIGTHAMAFEPGAMRRKATPHAWNGLAGTLRAEMGDNQEAVAYAIPIHDKATRFQGGGTTRHNDGAGNGLGVGQPGDPAPTMTAGDRHAVCYQQQIGALCSTDYKWVQQQQVEQNKLMVCFVEVPATERRQCYVVRRLTPGECAQLQGFPAGWCAGLGTPNPTEEELAWWSDVFETCRKVRSLQSRPKSRKWLTKWLSWPNSDTAEYKMWGNGIALPCAAFVLSGIAWVENSV